MIETRSGQHLLDYVREHLTRGLAIDADGSSPSTASALYGIDRSPAQGIPRTDMCDTWGGDGLAATPEALVRSGGRMMAQGIASADTWQAMLQPVRLADGTPARERDDEVGLGWHIGSDADGARIADDMLRREAESTLRCVHVQGLRNASPSVFGGRWFEFSPKCRLGERCGLVLVRRLLPASALTGDGAQCQSETFNPGVCPHAAFSCCAGVSSRCGLARAGGGRIER